jgi:lipopolysaccharide export system protein LptA
VLVCNSDSTASIKLGTDGTIEVTATDKEIKVSCQTLSVDGNVTVSGDLTVSSSAASTKISGNEITGTGA